MVHPLSSFGIFHTLLSLIPVAAGAYAFVREGRIDLHNRTGAVFAFGMLASVLTSFGLSSTGGLNEAHALGVVALLALGFGYLAPRLHWLGRAGEYLQNLALTFCFTLLFIPAINETLKRIPPSQPLADGPQSPIVQKGVALVLVLFAIGAAYQAVKLYRRRYRGS